MDTNLHEGHDAPRRSTTLREGHELHEGPEFMKRPKIRSGRPSWPSRDIVSFVRDSVNAGVHDELLPGRMQSPHGLRGIELFVRDRSNVDVHDKDLPGPMGYLSSRNPHSLDTK